MFSTSVGRSLLMIAFNVETHGHIRFFSKGRAAAERLNSLNVVGAFFVTRAVRYAQIARRAPHG